MFYLSLWFSLNALVLNTGHRLWLFLLRGRPPLFVRAIKVIPCTGGAPCGSWQDTFSDQESSSVFSIDGLYIYNIRTYMYQGQSQIRHFKVLQSYEPHARNTSGLSFRWCWVFRTTRRLTFGPWAVSLQNFGQAIVVSIWEDRIQALVSLMTSSSSSSCRDAGYVLFQNDSAATWATNAFLRWAFQLICILRCDYIVGHSWPVYCKSL